MRLQADFMQCLMVNIQPCKYCYTETVSVSNYQIFLKGIRAGFPLSARLIIKNNPPHLIQLITRQALVVARLAHIDVPPKNQCSLFHRRQIPGPCHASSISLDQVGLHTGAL